MATTEVHWQKARAQLDPGAMLSLITLKLARTIKAKRLKNSAVNITGVGGDIHSPYQVEMTLKSLYSDESMTIVANVVDDIPAAITPLNISHVRNLPVFKGLTLTDPVQWTSGYIIGYGSLQCLLQGWCRLHSRLQMQG